MAQRKSLTETVLDGLLEGVFSGRYPWGGPLPSEAEIALEFAVSRVTVREALRTLQAGGIVEIRRGIGTFVNAPGSWTSLETVLRYASQHADEGAAALDLIEVRRMVETGAVALAALFRSADDLAALHRELDAMRRSAQAGDQDAFVVADAAFHDVILRASGNMFVPVLFEPLRRLVHEGRVRSLSLEEVREKAIVMHSRILAAIESADPAAARREMDAHMDQVAADLRGQYPGRTPHAARS